VVSSNAEYPHNHSSGSNLSSSKKHTLAKLKKQEIKAGSAGASLTSFDITSWVAQSNTAANMDESEEVYGVDNVWTRERVLQDWNRSVEHARTKLLVEKVKGRVAFLQEDILSVVRSVGAHPYALFQKTFLYRLTHGWLRSKPVADHGRFPIADAHISAIRRR
jgi:hypothetical protein